MRQLEEPNPDGVGRHLQEYIAGVAGIPPREEKQAITLVTAGGLAKHQEPIVVSEGDEVARLRQLLHEKDHAVFRAVVSANELRAKLEETQAETESLKSELAQVLRQPESAEPEGEKPPLPPQALEEIQRQRKEWLRIQKSLEQEHAHRKAELVQVRGQWFATQQQLDQESRARRSERAQAASKIAGLERSLENANTAIVNMRNEKTSSGSKRGMLAAAASLVLAVGGAAIWTQFSAHASAPPPPPAVSKAIETAPSKPRLASSVLLPGSQKGFQGSLGRLNQALAAFGSRPAEDVLAEVRKRSGDPTVCAFRWNNGQPAVIFNGGMKESLATSLNRCAAAIEKAE